MAGLAREPSSAKLMHAVGMSNLKLADVGGALESFDKAIEASPDLAEPHSGRALALVAAGRMDDAAAEFEMALRLDPKYFDSYPDELRAYEDLRTRRARRREPH